jgi:predicted transposase/invertase (TIGR01784 family)
MSNPHDALFKRIFRDLPTAAGQFRSVLPAGLAEKIDWRSLRIEPGSFVDERFRELHTDLLYSVRLRGREAFLYLLMEHQSTSPPLMTLRMLGYVVRVLEDFVKSNPNANKVPAVIPVVMHHSEQGWSAPTSLIELVDLDEEMLGELQRNLPSFEILLDDLTRRSDRELFGRATTAAGRLTLFCLKRAMYSGDFRRELVLGLGALREVATAADGAAALESVLRYIMEVREDATDWLGDFVAEEVSPEAEEAYMTAAEKLRQEGMLKGLEKGRIEGLEKGRVEGRVEGQTELVLKLLALKFGPLSVEQAQRVQGASIEQLDRWAERVLDAESIAEVLGE